ncbi:peptidase S24 [Salinimicrobium tongyeongense]|uniref:Peptidase S24 n=1 Tax=Salinimicrobium tongyeongense TaxID=2809707 RepID=A0ABY6NSP5_9FLAO|nr:S24 family peptidase [Salinimicrobium tongyeongense]UZH55578.1 peptidase S24 [Salinimicrobium tongyeongense]
MQRLISEKIRKGKDRHRAEVSKQTGFPSAATHYYEPPIDLNNELVYNQDSTFFVRVEGSNWSKFNIWDKDVLIIDRSMELKPDCMALIVKDGEFDIVQFSGESTQPEFLLWGVVTYVIHAVI